MHAPISRADLLAVWEEIKKEFTPYCHSLDYAGNLKRGLLDTKLTVVVSPKWNDTRGLGVIRDLVNTRWGKPRNPFPGGVLTEVRRLKPIDFHWTQRYNYGWRLFYLTGPYGFVQRAMGYYTRTTGGTVNIERLIDKNGEHVDTPDETTVFKLLGCSFIEPAKRSERP